MSQTMPLSLSIPVGLSRPKSALGALLVSAALLHSPQAMAALTANANGTVTDTVTGLVWDQCPDGLSGGACAGGVALTADWPAALNTAVAANGLSYKGFTDWRLPNLNELESIVKLDVSSPAIDSVAFPATPSGVFWSSSSYGPIPTGAWNVDFDVGLSSAVNSTDTYYVRLVRSGQPLAAYDLLNSLLAQTITGFAPVSPVTFGAAAATLTATSGGSSSAIVYGSSTPGVCTVAVNQVTFVGAGTCNLTADQAGDANYNAAPQATASITVNKAAQAITGFAPVSPVTFGAAAATLTATSGGSSSAIVYGSSTPGVCTVAVNQVTFVGAGTCNLTADQAGDANYNAAPQATASIVVDKASQTLSFGVLPVPVIGNGGTVSASSTSGLLGVVYASSTPTVCTVNAGGAITVLAAGTCTVTADLAASANYTAALRISQNFTITPLLGQVGNPFAGTTVPGAGAGGPASASFTTATGGITCRFDAPNTAFVASPAPYPVPGSTAPHGAFKFKLIGCTPGFTAQISVNWPSLAGATVFKYGKATALAAASTFFAPMGLSIVGNTATYTVTDGALGDDDWAADGVIIDPIIPVVLPGGDVQTVPTLGEWALLLLAGMLGALGLMRAGGLRAGRNRRV